VPEIVRKVEKMVLFQRTPNWFFPRNDKPYSDFSKWMFRNVGGAMRLHRWMIYLSLESRFLGFKQDSAIARYLKKQLLDFLKTSIPDEKLRASLTPDYPVGCKRIIISDDFLPAIQKPNVHVDVSGIASFTENSVIDKTGQEHRVDTVIYGTGFEATEFLVPIEVTGKNGVSLNQAWQEGAEAYQGATVSGFPNMFILYGPNTNLGHNSIIFMVENQVRHMIAVMTGMRARNLKSIDVKPDVMRKYNVWLQDQLKNSVWNAGCNSWYINKNGKVTQNWPHSTFAWWNRMRKTSMDDFGQIK
jgi:cation diffusion facilitator CzcD-associated flavoprotein CzcO